MKYVLENNNFEVNGKQYLKDVGGYDGTNVYDSKDVATVISEIVSTIPEMISVTYDELVSLRNNKELIPGKQYRITDYTTTTTQENTISAGHQFDIIVTALDESTLSEEAKAIQKDNDNYFNSCNLSAWKIWYSLDNDTERFEWADSENGKGVIYRMIDEWGNDCPYDFKNIMFKRGLYANGSGIATKDGEEDFFTYCYTFSWEEDQNVIMDASIFGNDEYLLNEDEERQINGVYGNIIGVYNSYDGYDKYPESTKQYLNDIVFFSTYGYEYGNYYGCHSNTFGNECYSNTFGNECYSNTFGNNCSSNTFDDSCYSNTFGNECYSNTFGNGCCANTFGNNCSSNTFGNSCSYNTFGNECYSNTFDYSCSYNTFGNRCYSNTFGNNCSDNTFGNRCYSNTFGNSCSSNTFGNNCYSNTFGNSCSYNTFGDNCRSNKFGSDSDTKSYYRHIIFDNGNSYIMLNCTETTGSLKYYQNVRIGLGVNNKSTYKVISDANVGQKYETLYRPTGSQTKDI